MKELLGHGYVPETEVSIIILCLNNAVSVEECILAARGALCRVNTRGEVIVADLGSCDQSVQIIMKTEAILLRLDGKGPGFAVMKCMESAAGKYAVIGDASGAYDFNEAGKFIEALQAGNDFLKGCRYQNGGGIIRPGGMSLIYKVLWAPLFTLLFNLSFRTSLNDVLCGFWGISRVFYHRLWQRCLGQEYNLEILAKSVMLDARIREIPVTYHRSTGHSPSGRLETDIEVCQALAFMSIYSPWHCLPLAGVLMILGGGAGCFMWALGVEWSGFSGNMAGLILSCVLSLAGYSILLIHTFARIFAVHEQLIPRDSKMFNIQRKIGVSVYQFIGLCLLLVGTGLMMFHFSGWRIMILGDLSYNQTLGWLIVGGTLITAGWLTVLSSILLRILGLSRK